LASGSIATGAETSLDTFGCSDCFTPDASVPEPDFTPDAALTTPARNVKTQTKAKYFFIVVFS
jgi:hypothetical protein